MRARLLSLSLSLAFLLAGCGGGGGKHSTNSSPTPSTVTFAANSIVYGVANGTNADFAVDQIAPTGGTPKTVVADVDGAILAFALDPSQPSRYALAAADGTGTYGIYLSQGLSLSGAKILVAPAYVSVGSLAVTADGTRVVYTGVTADGVSHLYVVPTAGGTPVDYGTADQAAVSPDGDTVAFTDADTTHSPGGEFIALRSLAAGAAGAVQTVEPGFRVAILPTFSGDGKRLAYWMVDSEPEVDANLLKVRTMATGATSAIPGALDPQGLAFSADGATLATVGQAGTQSVIETAPADGSDGLGTILTSSATLGNYGFFWTDANGRAVAGSRGGLSASRTRRKSRL